MAFPVNGVLDNFNRTNEGPPPSANWTIDPFGYGEESSPNLVVVSNACGLTSAGTGTHSCYWDPVTFGPDCEGYVTLPTPPAAGSSATVYARLSPIGATCDGYGVRVLSSTSIFLRRMDDGAGTQLGTSFSQATSAGDSFGIECVGSTITAYYKASAGSWGALGNRTDATYNQSGNLALLLGAEIGTRFDDFGGGTLAASITVSPPAGALTLTAKTPALDLALSPAKAALSLTGKTPGLDLGLSPGKSSLVLTAGTPQLVQTAHQFRSPPAAGLVLTAGTPQLAQTAHQFRSPPAAGLALTAQTPGLDLALSPVNASLALTASTPQLDITSSGVNIEISPPPATDNLPLVWDLIEGAIGYEIGYGTTSGSYDTIVDVGNVSEYLLILPSSGIWYVNIRAYDFAPGEWDTEIVFDASPLVLTASTPTLDLALAPASAGLVLDAQTPQIVQLGTDREVSPPAASLVLTGSTPQLATTGDVWISPDAAALFLNASTAQLVMTGSPLLSPDAAALVITASTPQLEQSANLWIAPPTAELTINTATPILLLSGLIGRRRQTRQWKETTRLDQLDPVVEQTKAELVSLLDHQTMLRNSLDASVGEGLRQQRADLQRELSLVKQYIADTKARLRAEKQAAEQVYEARIREQKRIMAQIKKEQDDAEEAEIVEVVNFVIGMYE